MQGPTLVFADYPQEQAQPERRRRCSLKGALGAAAFFGAGVVTGVAWDKEYTALGLPSVPPIPPPPIHFSTLCTNEGKLPFLDAITNCEVIILNKNDGFEYTASFLDAIESPVRKSETYCLNQIDKKSFAQCVKTVFSPDTTKPSRALLVDTDDDGNHDFKKKYLKKEDIKKAIDMYRDEVKEVLDKKTLDEINKNADDIIEQYGSGEYYFIAP